MAYNGQALQDKYVLNVLNHKKNGYFIEIGSHDPICINNTYILETKYDWKGIMIEMDSKYLNSYKNHRPNSIHVINDATKINYKELFETNNVPKNIDYLQLDLEPTNNSTLLTLMKLNDEIFNNYKFATITFEHDCKNGLSHLPIIQKTRIESRNILKNRGYICVFEDINNQGENPFEDWYVHPELVNMEYITNLIDRNKQFYKYDKNTELSINYQDIQY